MRVGDRRHSFRSLRKWRLMDIHTRAAKGPSILASCDGGDKDVGLLIIYPSCIYDAPKDNWMRSNNFLDTAAAALMFVWLTRQAFSSGSTHFSLFSNIKEDSRPLNQTVRLENSIELGWLRRSHHQSDPSARDLPSAPHWKDPTTNAVRLGRERSSLMGHVTFSLSLFPPPFCAASIEMEKVTRNCCRRSDRNGKILSQIKPPRPGARDLVLVLMTDGHELTQ